MLQSTSLMPAHISSFKLGGKNILVVSDGEVLYDINCFAPGIPKNDLNAVREQKTDTIPLTHNILVLAWNERVVLIDAGNGHTSGPQGGHLVNNLTIAGITPEIVTDVVLTHAHPDHLGGLINIHNQLVFPAATVHIAKAEYDFWMSDTPDFTGSKNNLEALRSVQQNIKRLLQALEGSLQFFTESDYLFDFLQPIAAEGHTPGHFMFSVKCGDQQFIHIADLCHEAIMLFEKPEWGTVFDIDFELAARVRRRVLNELAASGKLVFGYHMPWPGFGRVVKKGNGFCWEICE
ncbi:glyoxylase-like metal-dependent hydrolase (beta-lactamase superfamily II) [Chitinophaga terrae (ex Kim and Jung 2007)]|uniref:MBL fold metallo-hydrolase n=1 Tax=Chitinophaga terrae (ex Kim and Jung 2007) TaxID=408074 RepID=UPI0027835A8E|nr:MBL fold metallo-hydrolase [Chitinophaga terrae (ex Kim and Jung 2007)]MDQ0105904.1 glyoxylase-like metal-dependent hydrolase (beta-lactamase superfamily II) [Chitinophaga terrae (ex Kim and Jung 2007)]